jgi:hypothetical protein
VNTTLATTATTALDQLNRSLAKGSLGDLVQARTKRTLLLVDVSGSMAHMIVKTGKRRIDALRGVVADLRSTHNVPVAAFGLRGRQPVDLLEGGHCKMNLLPEDTSVDDECDACGAMKSWDGSAWVCGHCTCDQCGKDADDCECDGGVQ